MIMADPLLESIWNLLLILWLSGTATGLGWRLVIRYVADSESTLLLWVFSTTIGLSAMAYTVFLLATCQWLTPMALNICFVIMTGVGGWGWISFRHHVALMAGFGSLPLWERIACALSLCVMAGALLITLTPAIGNDALVYHLTVPKHYLAHHGFYFIPGNIFAQYPLLPEMLYLAALHFSNDILAKLIHFVALILLAAGTAGCLQRLFRTRGAWLSVLVVVTVPSVYVVAHQAYSDLYFTLFTFLSVVSFIQWTSSNKNPWLAICGICVGCAMSTKYAGLILPPITVLAVLLHARDSRDSTLSAFRWLGIVLFWIIITGCPFYLKNWWITGNPMYPFFTGLFPSPGWSPDQARQYDVFLKYLGMGRDWIDYFSLPWNLSFHARFDSPRFDGYVGPIFLLGLIALAVKAGRHSLFRWAAGFVFFYFVFWATTAQQIRYLLPVMPILALSISSMMHSSGHREWIRTGFGCLTVLAIIWNGTMLTRNMVDISPTRYLLGTENRNAFLARHLPSFETFQHINRALSDTDRIFLVYMKNRGFLLDRPFYSDSLFESHTLKQILSEAATPKDVLLVMREHGFTHIAFDKVYVTGELTTLSPKALELFDAFTREMLVPLGNHADRFMFYRIRSSST